MANTSTRLVSEVVLATFAATIMTFPLIIYHFDRVSLVSPLANLLILPAQPGIMTWGGTGDVSRYDFACSGTNAGLVSAAQRGNTPVRGVSGGEVIEFGSDVQIEILHAGALPGSDEDNDESIVMQLVYDGFSLLLTGDAGHTAEGAILRSGKDVQSAVLKAGHHGSNTASSRNFLQAVNPQIVIISGGGERYDHPHEEVLQRIGETGSAVWRTDESGTIELISDGKMIWSNVGSMDAGLEHQ